ncbi:DNA primase [bacterium]|nr:DNA primase [bacterium]
MNSKPKGGFSKDFIERVIESADVVSIIGRYTSLKKAGKNFKGLCPFHKEKTPSFSVDPDRGLFYCFGCGKGGNVVSFVMEKEGLSFPEAIEFLAKESGIPIPQRRVMSSANEALQNAVETAYEFYRKSLQSVSGKQGIEYLSGRGIDSKFAKKFGFGWAPFKWDSLASYIKRKNLGGKAFLKTGLLIQKQGKNSLYDRFRGGIIIPIRNSAERLVGFALRSLPDKSKTDEDKDRPKYINSPESSIYHKSDVLFGLDKARKHIRKMGYAILVEGYFDVLSLWSAGFENTVASCGTSFTRGHANLLARFTDTVVVFYDGDDAGLKATYRATEPLLRQELIVKIARPPEKLDPDDVARQWKQEKTAELIENAQDWLDFSSKVARENGLLDSVEGKFRFADRIAPYIIALGKGLLGSLYRKKLAQLLDVSENQISGRITKISRKIGKTRIEEENLDGSREDELPQDARIELDLIARVISNPMLVKFVYDTDIIVLYKGVMEQINSIVEEKGECSPGMLAEYLEPRAVSYITKAILNFSEMPSQADIDELIQTIKRMNIDKDIINLRNLLSFAQEKNDKKKINEILKKMSKLKREKIELSNI